MTPTEAVLALRKPTASEVGAASEVSKVEVGKVESNSDTEEAVLRMKLVGANPSSRVSGLEELPGKSNYFLGNDPKKWRTNVPHYAKIQYKDVYPGVDLVYYGNQRQLEYDLIVTPGANPEAIQLAFEGEDDLEIDAQGDLVLDSDGGQVRLHKPFVYQQVDGVRQEISGAYVLNGGRQVSFEVAAYDVGKPLIIDPVLSYSTYLGGSASGTNETGFGIAVDVSGNAYVTGQTASTDFPTASPLQAAHGGGSDDLFVTKLNAAGSALLYSTYLGGSGRDEGLSIAVDAAGNAYVTGFTRSTNFPTASPFQAAHSGGVNDVFATKLNPDGSALVYSTYLGGTSSEEGTGIAVDVTGNAYVIGSTRSANFPTANPFQATIGSTFDNFVTKLNAAGSALVYSTYLGGTDFETDAAITVDSSGNAYVTGTTMSTDFPTSFGAFDTTLGTDGSGNGGIADAFVAKFNAAGSALVYSTYLGGSSLDEGLDIAVDAAGNAYVTGSTRSTNFPTASPFQVVFNGPIDAFVTKLNVAGSALVYSTYLEGAGSRTRIAVDASGNAYVTGITPGGLPTANPFQATHAGFGDAFVMKFNAAGSDLICSSYLGGSNQDSGRGIAVDSLGNAYVTGTTDSTDFPTASPLQAAHGGGQFDAFVAKITIPPTLPTNSVVNGASFRPAAEANSAIAPGAIVAIFGTDLAGGIEVATDVPLPTTLGDTSVTFDDIAAPLFFVSPTQINAQVPFELMTGTGMVMVQVRRGSETSEAQPIGIAAVSPGIFTLNEQGTGAGAILHAEDFQPVNDSAPAQPGEFILIFCTGLGSVQPEVPSGDVAPSTEPLARTVTLPMVNIAGIAADVAFSGLAPGFVGLYQVNAQVPAGVPAGTQEVEILVNNVPGNTVTIAVQ